MMRCTAVAFALALSTNIHLIAHAEDAIENKGRLDAVTVYRGQALVTRVIEAPGPAGLREIVITDLPEQVVPGSLYAESADGVEVRSVIFRQRPVKQDVREEVRTIDAKIRQVQDQLWTNTQSGNRVVDLHYRLAIENFGTQAAKVRLLDRKPVAEGTQVKLTLVESTPEPSATQTVDKNGEKNGILRWDLEVAARTNGAALATVDYHLRMEYDKQMSITGLAMSSR